MAVMLSVLVSNGCFSTLFFSWDRFHVVPWFQWKLCSAARLTCALNELNSCVWSSFVEPSAEIALWQWSPGHYPLRKPLSCDWRMCQVVIMEKKKVLNRRSTQNFRLREAVVIVAVKAPQLSPWLQKYKCPYTAYHPTALRRGTHPPCSHCHWSRGIDPNTWKFSMTCCWLFWNVSFQLEGLFGEHCFIADRGSIRTSHQLLVFTTKAEASCGSGSLHQWR